MSALECNPVAPCVLLQHQMCRQLCCGTGLRHFAAERHVAPVCCELCALPGRAIWLSGMLPQWYVHCKQWLTPCVYMCVSMPVFPRWLVCHVLGADDMNVSAWAVHSDCGGAVDCCCIAGTCPARVPFLLLVHSALCCAVRGAVCKRVACHTPRWHAAPGISHSTIKILSMDGHCQVQSPGPFADVGVTP
jgi:hypothetical protein